MISFQQYVTEELSASSLSKADAIINRYVRKKTSRNFFSAGLERYKNSKGKGIGMRYYASKNGYSFRLNWKAAGAASMFNIESVDFWDGKKSDATIRVIFEYGVSLVKVLPTIVSMVNGKMTNLKAGAAVTSEGEGFSLQEDLADLCDDQFTVEDLEFVLEGVNPDAFDGVVELLTQPGFKKGRVWSMYKSTGGKIFDELAVMFPKLIVKQGVKYVWNSSNPKDVKKVMAAKSNILEMIGATGGKAVKGGTGEQYEMSDETKSIENNRDRIAYEKQIEDLENLTKMTIAGTANALFVAGKGGIGKTFTVEKVLAEQGLSDGNGYFKNTGSASAAGIYSLLFKYHDSIVFFDDSDDALKDQSSRNIFKAATDTKKIRKLVWNKMGNNVVDPDEYASHEDLLEEGKIPRYFNFTGKIIFISNLPLDKLDPDGALRTRAFLVDINPTEMEVYDFMGKIVGNMKLPDGMSLDLKGRNHVVELLRGSQSKQSANFRKLERGLAMYAGAVKTGVNVGDKELQRMISMYA
jgi:hypothetical protein